MLMCPCNFMFFIYLVAPPPHDLSVLPIYGRVPASPCYATDAAREPNPSPAITSGEPISRNGRHRELYPGPPNLQTSVLPTELTVRQCSANYCVAMLLERFMNSRICCHHANHAPRITQVIRLNRSERLPTPDEADPFQSITGRSRTHSRYWGNITSAHIPGTWVT